MNHIFATPFHIEIVKLHSSNAKDTPDQNLCGPDNSCQKEYEILVDIIDLDLMRFKVKFG
jgi:hypothetical protein